MQGAIKSIERKREMLNRGKRVREHYMSSATRRGLIGIQICDEILDESEGVDYEDNCEMPGM